MKTKVFDLRLQKLLFYKNIWMGISSCLLLGILLLSWSILVHEEKVVFIPPHIKENFWVQEDKASSEYIEEMGSFFVHLLLDISPASAVYQREVLLRHVLPSQYGAMKSQLLEDEERLKKENVSTHFDILDMKISKEGNNLRVKGRLSTFVSGSKVSEKEKTYEMRLTIKKGRLFLESFKEALK